MTQTQFVEEEVKEYIKYLFPKVNKKQLEERLQESDYRFNEEEDKIFMDININGKYQTIVMGWSDYTGIYDLEVEEEGDDNE